jgi:hypothetical protein
MIEIQSGKAFFSETETRHEVRRGSRERGKREQRVLRKAAHVAEIFWKGGRHRADFVRNLLVG